MRDRIVGLERVKASELQSNERNWRTHPNRQRTALNVALEEIGLVDAVVARRDETGALILIDGHLRADVVGDQKIPVLVVDLDEAEADLALVTLDPLSAMAGQNSAKLSAIIDELTADADEALQEVLDRIRPADVHFPAKFPDVDTEPELEHKCPRCGFEFNDDTD